jgi:hypothetical protein
MTDELNPTTRTYPRTLAEAFPSDPLPIVFLDEGQFHRENYDTKVIALYCFLTGLLVGVASTKTLYGV